MIKLPTPEEEKRNRKHFLIAISFLTIAFLSAAGYAIYLVLQLRG